MERTRGDWEKESGLGTVRFIRSELDRNGVTTTWIKDLRWLQESLVDVLQHNDATRTISREWENDKFRDEVEYEVTSTHKNLRKTVTLVEEPIDGNYIICSITDENTQAHLSIDYEEESIDSIDFHSSWIDNELDDSGQFERLWSAGDQEISFYGVRFEFSDIFDDLVTVKVSNIDHTIIHEAYLPFGDDFRFRGTTYRIDCDTNNGVVFNAAKRDEKIFDLLIPKHLNKTAIEDCITTEENTGWENALSLWDVKIR